MVRSVRPLPDELHSLRIDACGDPEDVRCPGSADGLPSLRFRPRWAIVQPLGGGLRALVGRRSLRDVRLPCICRRRSRTTLKLEPDSGRRPILPREEAARSSTRNKDERCKCRRPPPASWPRASRLGRLACTRGRDRNGRRPRHRLLARLRKERARSLGQHMVDERELRADRAQLFANARGGPQGRAAPGRRALDDVWPRHAGSLTSLVVTTQMRRKILLFASVSIRNRPK
jgi:hypothetical protein